jgi:hypothetical protein
VCGRRPRRRSGMAGGAREISAEREIESKAAGRCGLALTSI